MKVTDPYLASEWEDYKGKPTVGDVVRMKAGSLPMTVEGGSETEVQCDWFDEKDKLHRGRFKGGMLRKKK